MVKATVEQLSKTIRRFHEEDNELADARAKSLKAAIQSGDDKHAVEREKAEVERAAAKVHRAAQSAAAEESIRHQEAKRDAKVEAQIAEMKACLLYTSPSPRDHPRSRMPSSA